MGSKFQKYPLIKLTSPSPPLLIIRVLIVILFFTSIYSDRVSFTFPMDAKEAPINFDLQRFVDAQEAIFDTVLSELNAERKKKHWMWYIFPQIKGLGQSPKSLKYSIASKEEAIAFLSHEILGPRLRRCTELVLEAQGTITQILGEDDVKFKSSMTLFDAVLPDSVFRQALVKYYNGEEDPFTIELLL